MAGRPSGPKVRCGGRWTEARYRTFIMSGIRGLTRKWAPIQDCLKESRTRKGYFMCAGCGKECPTKIKKGRKSITNHVADHIKPITDPNVGFTNWDDILEKSLCEKDNLQALCKECHDKKCSEEREIAVNRRRREKELKND